MEVDGRSSSCVLSLALTLGNHFWNFDAVTKLLKLPMIRINSVGE